MSPRRLAFVLPLALLVLVTLTHLGWRSGYYRSSRPDSGYTAPFLVTADGGCFFYDGVPAQCEAAHITSLGLVFRGARPEVATGPFDNRPVAAFLGSLLGAGVIGWYGAGLLVNLLFLGAAAACSVDLVLRLRNEPLAAGLFGALLVVHRGVGFYVGTPDAHALAFAWGPIVAWLYESLGVGEKDAPWSRALLLALALGAALLTYMGDAPLLGFLWVYGLRRTPLARLLAITGVAILILVGWHGVGRAIGLGFDAYSSHNLGDGLRAFAALLRHEAGRAFTPPENAPRDVALASVRLPLNAALVWVENLHAGDPLPQVLTKSLVPCFGPWLLGLALAGLVPASWRERRAGVALALPAIVAAWPLNTSYDVPRLSFGGAVGLELLGALALAGVARATSALLARVGAPPRVATASGVALAVLLAGAFALVENTDVWSRADVPRRFHYGS